MKKFMKSILLIVAIVAVSVLFAACQPTEEKPCTHSNAATLVISPTCVSEGYTEYVCPDCGYVYQDSFVESSNDYHEFIPADHKDATCTEEGYDTKICVYCEETTTSKIKVKEHQYGDWTVVLPTTCTELGYDERACVDCGLVVTRTATKTLDHNYVHHIITLPTCTEEGYTMSVCADCGIAYKTATSAIIEHSYDAGEVVASTCTSEGYTTFTCEACGYQYNDLYTDPIAHNFGEWAVSTQPTCEDGGEETRTCADCSYSETRHIIGHDYELTTHAPDCENPGYDAYVCTKCGYSYADNYVDALGHTWSDWYAVAGNKEFERRDCECGHYEVRSKAAEE